jgi:sugar-specific transcriptional regulator TrmB
MVISGRRNVYSKILQMIEEAEEEILVVTTRLGMIRADQAGLVEAGVMRAMEKSEAKGRILTYISKENLAITKRTILEASTKHVNIECRHVDLAAESCLRLVVKDGEEAILLVTPQEDLSIVSREDTGLWINNRAVAKAFKTFFERLWLDAKDADTRIREVETGKPAEETIIIKEARVADKKFREIVDATKEEIIGITSPRCVSRILEHYLIPQLFKRGVKIRIMAPINIDNLEAAQKLSEYCQIKHVDVAYVRMVIVDGKHLFQFKTPPSGEELAELTAYFDDTLYTNDPCYAERMKEMLNDVWQRSLDIKEIKPEVWDKTLLQNLNPTSLSKTV